MGIALLFLTVPAVAWAQIYSWRDANGNLVLSSHAQAAPGAPLRVYDVPRTDSIRSTRPVSRRGDAFEDLIVEHARLNDVRPDLVRAVVQVESGFNPLARSAKGALGLMQLMPATMHEFGVQNPFDPADNVRAGVAYLRQLLDRYDNNETLALAAYNAGPGAVDKHGQAVPPYAETRSYVAQIDRLASRPLSLRENRIYKVTEIVDGRTVVRYTDKKPTSGAYELLSR